MHLLPWLALLVAPLCLAIEAGSALQSELANLALAQNGNIMLDTATFDLLTSPRRNWSASIHFTALDARRRCGPCKYVPIRLQSRLSASN
jgi:oligosaccharyltransferase complex subunit gamma